MLRSYFRRRIDAILGSVPPDSILFQGRNANFFGLASKRSGQLRGNGTMVLTPTAIFFEMWIPKRRISIPLASITAVDTVRSHIKKIVFRDLLRVSFIDERGVNDSAAWWVPQAELSGWIQAIQAHLPHNA